MRKIVDEIMLFFKSLGLGGSAVFLGAMVIFFWALIFVYIPAFGQL